MTEAKRSIPLQDHTPLQDFPLLEIKNENEERFIGEVLKNAKSPGDLDAHDFEHLIKYIKKNLYSKDLPVKSRAVQVLDLCYKLMPSTEAAKLHLKLSLTNARTHQDIEIQEYLLGKNKLNKKLPFTAKFYPVTFMQDGGERIVVAWSALNETFNLLLLHAPQEHLGKINITSKERKNFVAYLRHKLRHSTGGDLAFLWESIRSCAALKLKNLPAGEKTYAADIIQEMRKVSLEERGLYSLAKAPSSASSSSVSAATSTSTARYSSRVDKAPSAAVTGIEVSSQSGAQPESAASSSSSTTPQAAVDATYASASASAYSMAGLVSASLSKRVFKSEDQLTDKSKELSGIVETGRSESAPSMRIGNDDL